MSPFAIRLGVGLVWILHGLGHYLYLLPLFGMKLTETHSADSWLLHDSTGAHVLGAVLYFLTSALFIGAGQALNGWFLNPSLWRNLAVWGSVLGILTIVMYWNGLPTLLPNKIGALLVDILTLYAVLIADWQPQLPVR